MKGRYTGKLRLRQHDECMSPAVVGPYIDEWTGIFVGGSTAWKLATMATWGQVARERDAYMQARERLAKRRQLGLVPVEDAHG